MEKILPYELSYLPDELKQRAKNELHECEAQKNQSLECLRAMLMEDTLLYWQDDDSFLLSFLRARKFDVCKAFQLVRTFYSIMQKHSELYSDFDYQDVNRTLSENSIGFLPGRDAEGCAVLVYQLGHWNPKLNHFGDHLRALTCSLLDALRFPATQVSGFKVIVDFKDFTLAHLPHVTPTYLCLLAEALQNCFPGRFKSIHIINETYLFTYIWMVLKQFLSKKVKERFHCHGKKVVNLQQYFPRSILPSQYQGDLQNWDNSRWAEQMLYNSHHISNIFTYGYHKNRSNKLN